MSMINVNTDDIQDDFPEIPTGVYPATINLVDFAQETDSDARKKDKNGNEYLKGDFVISEGEFVNNHLFIPYMRVDQQTFRDMCHSAGKRGVVTDTDELTGLPLIIKVVQETYKDKLQSKVSGFVV